MKERAPYVFICYRTSVSHEEAMELHDTLRGDFNVWQDTKIIGGQSIPRSIYENIQKSDVLLVVIGEGTKDSAWVQQEIGMARGLDLTILPIHRIDIDMSSEALMDLRMHNGARYIFHENCVTQKRRGYGQEHFEILAD